jgi:inner membrane transporter RhtA
MVVVAVGGLTFGSTIAKASGSPGPVFAFWRLLIGSVLWMIVVRLGKERLDRQALRDALPVGVLFGVNLSLFFTAANWTRIAHAEFIGSLAPLIVVPFAARRLKERVPRSVLVAGAVALAGVALILLTSRGSTNWTGNVLAVGATVTWGWYQIASRRVRRTLDTKRFMAAMTIGATVVTLPIGLATGKMFDLSAKGWTLAIVMAFSSGMICHGLLAWSQRVVPLTVISLISTMQPAVSSLWGVLFLDQSVRAIQIVGMAIVVVAAANIAIRSARG